VRPRGEEGQGGQEQGEDHQGCVGRQAHAARRHQAGSDDRELKRSEGATVEQIAAATGWQHHTIRGANSGALKKKLGLMVEATRTREVGPNKTGAKGSAARCPPR
jgi:hypothetical protein